MFNHFKRQVHYKVDKIFARGASAQFLLLAVLTGLVVGLGCTGYLLGLFSVANKGVGGIPRDMGKGLWDTLWWSMNLVLDAGSFTGNYGATPLITALAFVVTLLGMVIFGIFIGFVTAAVEERLAVLRRGDSEVLEKGHTLILGWSKKVFAIISLLSEYDPRMKFVVLADKEPEDMQAEIHLHATPGPHNEVILRRGSPNNIGELHRMAFTDARSIVLLAGEAEDDPDGNPDIAVVKTLMLLASFDGWQGSRPKWVGEILRHENIEVATMAGRGRIPLVATSDVVSKILVQSARQPGLSQVYAQLFAFEGSELYVQHFPAAEGKTVAQVLCSFPTALPIGISRKEGQGMEARFTSHLNTPGDTVIGPGDHLILLAEDKNIVFDAAAPAYHSPHLTKGKLSPPGHEKILILGWSDNLYSVLEQFDDYAAPGTPVTVLADHLEEDAQQLLEAFLAHPLERLKLTYKRENYTRRVDLQPHLANDLTCVILLADTSFGEKDPDARIIMASVLLRELQTQGAFPDKTQLVAEITDHENRRLLELTRVFDILVSPEITSMLLAQISQQEMLKEIFADMLDAEGVEVYLKPVSRYLPLGQPLTFKDVLSCCLQLNEMALGLVLGGDAPTVELNPARDKTYTFGPHDRVVVLAEDMYDG